MAAEDVSGGAGAGRTIIEEVRQIIAFVEEVTGLPSRWNGGLLILEDGTGEARAAQMLSRVSYLAKKEWSCSITVVESVLQDDQRWRTLLHEGLHSVSVGLTEPRYQQMRLWEEAVVESLQRLYRPLLFAWLALDVPESGLPHWKQLGPTTMHWRLWPKSPPSGLKSPFATSWKGCCGRPCRTVRRLSSHGAARLLTSTTLSASMPPPAAFFGRRTRRNL